jgi:redox-sensitive bicupin YhaK (pirin superfamily)
VIIRRPSTERGHADHGWLDTRHTFSFGRYYDPDHMGFRDLRVINDDIVAAGMGFGTHPHDNMEIVTYVLDGALEHRDSMGTGSVLRAHDVQRMTAGTGVTHSEFNHSPDEALRLLQIWILPAERGTPPGYQEANFAREEKEGKLRLIVSPDGRDGSLSIGQDASMYAAILAPGQAVTHRLAAGRHAWVQVARGSLDLAGTVLDEGDGAAVSDEDALVITGRTDAEFLLFDLA